MKQTIIFSCIAILLFNAAIAQEAPKAEQKSCSCAFSSIVQGGIMAGEKSNSAVLQTINGLRYKRWFAGIGVGLDFYHTRGIPLFLDIRRNILKGVHSPFVYADGGIHFAWEREKEKYPYRKNEFDNSVYLDMGLGYKWSFTTEAALLLSVGYSYKEIRQGVYYPVNCLYPPCPESANWYENSLNRISLKMGLQF